MDLKDKADKPNIFTIQVKGPQNEDHDHKQQLLEQLKDIPKDAQVLRIEDDTPSDAEWSILSDHFTSVKDLKMNSDFNEDLNDGPLPQHWPLERLVLSSSCGEVIRSPFILEGRVPHLVLLLTSGLRFEGPTSDELCAVNKDAITRGDAEADYMTVGRGTPDERKITMVSIPALVGAWMLQHYEGRSPAALLATPPPAPAALASLAIIENDAIDAFGRFTLALPHLAAGLRTLTLRSSSGLDFHFTNEALFAEVLPRLARLRTLVLTAGDVFPDADFLPALHRLLPPGLTTLRFRGPVSLAASARWPEWVAAFAEPGFLPRLERLSFVLDLDYEEDAKGGDRKKKVVPGEERLRVAKRAREELWRGAEGRGVVVEPFRDGWTEEVRWFEGVDERWEGL